MHHDSISRHVRSMVMPEDTDIREAGSRVGSRERQAVMRSLTGMSRDGYLPDGEASRRIELAAVADTRAELAALTVDLPRRVRWRDTTVGQLAVPAVGGVLSAAGVGFIFMFLDSPAGKQPWAPLVGITLSACVVLGFAASMAVGVLRLDRMAAPRRREAAEARRKRLHDYF